VFSLLWPGIARRLFLMDSCEGQNPEWRTFCQQKVTIARGKMQRKKQAEKTEET